MRPRRRLRAVGQSIAAVAAPFGRDLEATFARVERIVVAARSRGASLVVFPESTVGGYLWDAASGPDAPDAPPALAPDGFEFGLERLLAGLEALLKRS